MGLAAALIGLAIAGPDAHVSKEVRQPRHRPDRKFTDARIAAAEAKRLRKQQKRRSAREARRYE